MIVLSSSFEEISNLTFLFLIVYCNDVPIRLVAWQHKVNVMLFYDLAGKSLSVFNSLNYLLNVSICLFNKLCRVSLTARELFKIREIHYYGECKVLPSSLNDCQDSSHVDTVLYYKGL